MRSALRGTPSVIACGDATLPLLSPQVTKGESGERSEPEGVLSKSTNKKLPRRVAGGAFIFLF